MNRRAQRVVTGLVLSVGLVAPALVSVPAQATEATYVKKKVVVGKTHQGRQIVAYFRGDPKARRVLLILGQMHGDEPAGRRTALHAIQRAKPRAGTGLWIIPSMNPDGRARHTRTNARGVDLNRNWPTSGWIKGSKGSRTYGGPKKGSERETRAMMRFLQEHRPDYIASLHQPLNGIGTSDKDVAFEKRLAKHLGLKRKYFGVAQGKGTSPTLTGWYNRHHGRHGTAITVEYAKKPSATFVKKAVRGLMLAGRVHP
jgi:protein MpaA